MRAIATKRSAIDKINPLKMKSFRLKVLWKRRSNKIKITLSGLIKNMRNTFIFLNLIRPESNQSSLESTTKSYLGLMPFSRKWKRFFKPKQHSSVEAIIKNSKRDINFHTGLLQERKNIYRSKLITL